ncbi:glucoside xylosyltransferase 1 isoform X1 [Agrilus planipennis]|uniref:UDP-D-xylose:beta-D-glucoside alpha-1,3-D-xylosyltransferase n=1 Tax=Agrilus planipennis TaxID=224129 RepID=A0A1W4XLX4_AGRPL|nr:glucoside xylosyltransferase 1 isoform X1 [Agrilus planipennis]
MSLRFHSKTYMFLAITTVVLYILYTKFSKPAKQENNEGIQEINKQESKTKVSVPRNKIVVAVVACGVRLNETLTMIKSAVMFTQATLQIIVVTEENLIDGFHKILTEWKNIAQVSFDFKILPLTFPKENTEEWQKLFKPCASQRLFLPSVLHDVDSILYVDTDTLFLTPPEKIWEHFYKMNSSQMAALAPEHEDPNVGWYNRFARHPYYGKLGVNSGVMLMNLTRMRKFQWGAYVTPIYKKYKLKITWGDQDIINIIFHYHSDKLFIYPCRFNFRPDHCMYMSICKSAEKDGAAVLHGSRGFFHSDKQPAFKIIYNAFEKFQLGGDPYSNFYEDLAAELNATTHTNCGLVKDIFLKSIRQSLP